MKKQTLLPQHTDPHSCTHNSVFLGNFRSLDAISEKCTNSINVYFRPVLFTKQAQTSGQILRTLFVPHRSPLGTIAECVGSACAKHVRTAACRSRGNRKRTEHVRGVLLSTIGPPGLPKGLHHQTNQNGTHSKCARAWAILLGTR